MIIKEVLEVESNQKIKKVDKFVLQIKNNERISKRRVNRSVINLSPEKY
jgi:hypothetical protein